MKDFDKKKITILKEDFKLQCKIRENEKKEKSFFS